MLQVLADNSPQYCELARKRIADAHGLFLATRVIPVDEL